MYRDFCIYYFFYFLLIISVCSHTNLISYLDFMGIPSYYKRLCDRMKGLVNNTKPVAKIHWLWIDFNCMIYHCLQRDDAPPCPIAAATDDYQKKVWEDNFMRLVEKYLEKVINKVAPTEGIFVGVDGVVPLAKMKQQRMRRFKSVWEREQADARDPMRPPSWDKNSITPGTDFMNRLCGHLKSGYLSKTRRFLFSGVQESGEGEHKIMDAWRKKGSTVQKTLPQNNALYGLDADLIILSMLNRKPIGNVWLFREDIQEGQIIREPSGEERFIWFDIQRLEKILIENYGSTNSRQRLTNYLFAMTTLGNDFLPTGLSLKLREDGHDRLLQALDSVKDGAIGGQALLAFFKNLASDESARIQTFIRRKITQGDSIGIETGLGQKNYPLGRIHMDEGTLLDSTGRLHRDWEARYLAQYFPGTSKHRICREYIRGMRWVWNYYTGQMDDAAAGAQSDKWTWVYPWHMPPLWSWLVKYLETYDLSQIEPAPRADNGEQPVSVLPPPQPLEQLTLVLPIQSWNLIPCQRHRQFADKCPQYFPNKYSFFSTGRRFFWECEADIPIPTIMEIRKAVET